MKRRAFAKTITAASCGAGFGLLPSGFPGSSEKKASRVVLVRSPELIRSQNDLNRQRALKILNQALKAATGCDSSGAAWKKLFSSGEKVGIKLSCLPGKYLSSTPGLVTAIAEGLKSAGIRGRDIFIWDRSDRELIRAGYTITRDGINIFGTDNIRGGGYSDRVEVSRSVGTCFSRILEAMDALISVPVLKDHDIAGVSIGMKNFYGGIHNPNKFHGNCCNPYVADLCAHPYIKNRLRLTVCDASRIQVNNGPAFYPGYAREYGGLLVGTDPVALDVVGWQVIEEERKKLGLKSLKESGREPAYLYAAGKLGLGHAHSRDINLIEMKGLP